MKKVICENGHFYDADRFELCPICGQSAGGSLSASESHSNTAGEITVPLPQSSIVDELGPTEWIPPEKISKLWGNDIPEEPPEPSDQPEDPDEPQETSGLGQQVDELAPTMWIVPDLNAPTEDENPLVPPEPEEIDEEPTGEINVDQPVEIDEQQMDAQPCLTLAQAVAEADALGISPVVRPVRRKETIASSAVLPVGWLVGLSGASKGKIFPCKTGRNCIGRDAQMDISLPDELSVDQITHSQIIYEPKKRQFFLQAGSGNGLSYLNDELIFTHKELHAYDRVTLGDAEFIFLPLCGEFFDWNMNMREE